MPSRDSHVRIVSGASEPEVSDTASIGRKPGEFVETVEMLDPKISDCFGRCQAHIDRHAAAAVRTDTTAAPAEHAAAFRTEENLQ